MSPLNTKMQTMVGLAAVLVMIGAGCSKQETKDVAISSGTVSNPTGALMEFPTDAYAMGTPTTLKFCVKRIKLEGEDGDAVKKDGEKGENGEDDSDDIAFSPGVIDVGSGTSKDWGSVNIPVGFKLKKIKIKVKRDATVCSGFDYSVYVSDGTNTFSTVEDVEFKWKFEPAIDLDASTQALKLSFSQVVSLLSSVSSNQELKSKIESVEEDASKE